jgi:hypothetical protein
MSRSLTADEQVRYPWATEITDFVPVGRWRRRGALCAWAGAALYVLGAVGIYVFASIVATWHGIPDRPLSIPFLGLGILGMAAGFVIGIATLPKAIASNARSPIAWSAVAMLPLLIFAVIAFIS